METRYCGIDLHKRFSTACIVNQAGEIIEEKKLMHRGGDLQAYFSSKMALKCAFEPMDGWGLDCAPQIGHVRGKN